MRKLSKILVLMLALAMMFTLASMFTVSAAGETKTIYFKPYGSAWIKGDERYAVYSWDPAGATWHDLTDPDGDGVYSAEIPAADKKVIFCRMDGKNLTNDWGAKWEQTVDITLGTTDTSKVYFTNLTTKDGSNYKYDTKEYEPAHICTPKVVEEVPSTCIKPGYQVKVCSDPACGARTTVDLPIGHTLSGGVCSVCGFNTAEEHTVYFKNTDNWATVKAYYWGTNNPVAWPGAAITEENGLYAVTLPAGSYNVIFNNQVNDVGPKSVDLVVPAEPMVYNWETNAWEELPHEHNYVNDMLCECGKAKFPTAKVTPILNEKLSFALNFTFEGLENWTEEYANALIEQYGNWLVDFRLTISGLEAESVRFNANDETADGYLGGEYGNYGWWYVPFSDAVVENNGSLLIMKYAATSNQEPGLIYTLGEVAQYVVDFDCGMYFTPEFLEANPDVQVKLELVVVPVEDGVQGEEESLTTNVFGKNDAHAHEYGEGSVTLAPTCLTNGTYTQTCACGKVVETEIPASADYHYYVLDVCYYCGNVNPSLEVGENSVTVDSTGMKVGIIYIPEAGTYKITSSENSIACLFTTKIGTEGADWSTPNAGSWLTWAYEEELEAGYYYYAVYNTGTHTVTVSKVVVDEECEHTWTPATCKAPATCSKCNTTQGEINPEAHFSFADTCLLCGKDLPTFVVGNNHVVYVPGAANLMPDSGDLYVKVQITEPGTYVISGGAPVMVFMWSIPTHQLVNGQLTLDTPYACNVDVMAETGFADSFEITVEEAGVYWIGFAFDHVTGEYEFDINIALKEVTPDEPTEDEPTEEPTEPQQPTEEPEELGFFAKIWAKIAAFFASIAEFFKGIFVKG